jgi:FkbM family methyltransferase
MISDLLSGLIKHLKIYARGTRSNIVEPRSSVIGLLQQARNVGLLPSTVIDVGAAYGAFTWQCLAVFPDAEYILIEPLVEYKPFLEKITGSIQRANYILAVAAAEQGEIPINVHPDLEGSSLYREEEPNSGVNGFSRTVQAMNLDSLMKEEQTKGPFLIKVDVQGAELDVLMGAGQTLLNTEYILLEVSLFEFFKGGPDFFDVITFMKAKGFVVYDICGFLYRPLDNALSQVDLAFVKEDGLFRKHHYYATPSQREEQNRRFEARKRVLSKRVK